MFTQKEIENATIEAIYWWNRTEFHYNYYFNRMDKISKSKDLQGFFAQKIFEVFLKEYSIRRNLPAGYKSVDSFIDKLNDIGFFKAVQSNKADIKIIDVVSRDLKKTATTKETKSLLSKIAFLVNPSKFVLYDSLAKKSIWEIIQKDKSTNRKDLENYFNFHQSVERLLNKMKAKGDFKDTKKILSEFKGTEAYTFFSKNEAAFQLRIIDKLLWIRGQNKTSRKINNEQYSKLRKL